MDPEAKSSTNPLQILEKKQEEVSEFIKHETQSTDTESEDEHLRSSNPAKSRSIVAAEKSMLPVYVYTYEVFIKTMNPFHSDRVLVPLFISYSHDSCEFILCYKIVKKPFYKLFCWIIFSGIWKDTI